MAGEEAAPLLPPQPPPPQLGPPPRVRGGVGATASGLLRRVSWLSEETPLFLESVFKPGGVPLFFSEEDALVAAGAGRFLATGEAAISKVFWDGFCWERASFFAARLGYGPATLVRPPSKARAAEPTARDPPIQQPRDSATHR